MTPLRHHLERGCDLAAMIHLPALPGTPGSALSPSEIVARAVSEAKLYRDAGITTVLLENMHDRPYVRRCGPEVVATMTAATRAVVELGDLYVGVQVLAGCNREALAVAHAAGAHFVRVEGFVFAHVGDEGVHQACAGELLRFRRALGAEEILVFADIKKKHASHALTGDVDLVQTAKAAAFFLADGVVVTGRETGDPVRPEDLDGLRELGPLVAVGSGVAPEQLSALVGRAHLLIVGSWLKKEGLWYNAPDPDRVEQLVTELATLMS